MPDPSSGLPDGLGEALADWDRIGRLRDLPPASAAAAAADFCSNDYLGLSRDPDVIAAGQAALAAHGAGGRASRLLAGGSPLHAAVEAAAAQWLGAERGLLFPSGYQANLGLLSALAGAGDAVFSDALNHASIIDAARLSRARVQVFGHLDLADLERRLARTGQARRRIVVSETVFSMDGDCADVQALHDLCVRYDAWLVLDESHAAGLLGPEGSGAWGQRSGDRLLARLVGCGKALGVTGGLVVGGAALQQLLVNRARGFVFSTAVAPAVAGSLQVAIARCRTMDRERDEVLARTRAVAESLGLPRPAAAILPVPVGRGGDAEALHLATDLQERGFAVRAVRPPTVPEGSARLRLVFHHDNDPAAVDALVAVLRERAQGAERTATATHTQANRRPLYVVGTDTGVGKTVISALLLRAAQVQGDGVTGQGGAYWKPVQTGDDDDTGTVSALAGVPRADLPDPGRWFPLPASPHEAAAAVDDRVELADVLERLRALPVAPVGPRIVEFAGGLLVPYGLDGATSVTQADFLLAHPGSCVLVARSGLGTLNHTMLTLEALRSRGIEPRALFLVGEPHRSNRATLVQVSGVARVFEVPPFEPLETAALDRWLADHDLREVLAP